jgi:hypothetical protein
MILTIKPAENGYVVISEDDQEQYFFVALDIDDACATVKMLLEEEAYQNADMSSIAFQQVPNDKA